MKTEIKKKITPINITSCHLCNPGKWKIIGESVGEYKCLKCKEIITKVIIKKETKGE